MGDDGLSEATQSLSIGEHIKAFALACGIAILGSSGVKAAAPNTFDLLCAAQTGQSYRYRFDVQQKKWCMGECHSVWGIDEIGDSSIKMSLSTRDNSDYWTINIDRYTSKFWIVRRGYGNDPKEWGECKVQPFSGFPQRQF